MKADPGIAKTVNAEGLSGTERVVYWDKMVTPYGIALMRSLASSCGFDVVYAVELEGTRSYWDSCNMGAGRLVSGVSAAQAESLIDERESVSLHIFSHHIHPRGLPVINAAFRKGLRSKARVALMGEGKTYGGPRRLLRRGLDTYYGMRFSSRIGFILAQGIDAEAWFKGCGYPSEKIFPFGYFVDEEEPCPGESTRRPGDPFTMIYIGHCIERKGLDILLSALAGVRDLDWRFVLVGDGDKRSDLVSMADRLGLADRVSFRGFLLHGEARSLLCQSDLLVLPSRYDAWGVVVNEALATGVPAVCSDRCGAKELLDGAERGAVFKSESVEALRDLLAQRIACGKRDSEVSARIRKWAKAIGGESIARYVVDVAKRAYCGGSHPTPPWLS